MAIKTERSGPVKERLTIRKRGQVTLPKALLERFHLEEGDNLELSVDEETGVITIVPLIQVPATQKWFWTEQWQKEEQEAEENIKAGHVKSFDQLDEALEFLDSEEAEEWANEDKK